MRGKPAAAALALIVGMTAQGAPPSATSIYTCVDAKGNRLTSDRPIPDCSGREQRVLNDDGSLQRVIPPLPTADERAEVEARERATTAERMARADAIRRDRNLLARYPNEAAHRAAREAALDDVRKAVSLSQARMALLATERKPLLDETEFYVGRALPQKLRTQLDANDASTEAQRNLIQNQQAEVVRINQRFDIELERLRKLWSGAQAGSMGPLPSPAAAPAVEASAAHK